MVKGGEAFSHKCSRTTSIKICNPNFHKEFVTLDHSFLSCSGISLEDGWHPQSTGSKNQKVNLELSTFSSDHNYRRAHSKQVECQSRLGVQECSRFIRLETSSESFSENNQTLRNPSSRSVCLQAVPPTPPIYGMEARSKQFCYRRNAAGLGKNVWFYVPTLQPDRSGDKQGSSGKCGRNDINDTYMADTTLIFSSTRNAYATSIAFTTPPKPITKSSGRKTSSCENQVPKASGLGNYRKGLEIEGILSSAAKLISTSRRPCSIAGYKSAWNKWVSWCCRQQIDPVCALLSGVLNYLSTFFEKGLQYRTINSHRSAISAYYDYEMESLLRNILESVLY